MEAVQLRFLSITTVRHLTVILVFLTKPRMQITDVYQIDCDHTLVYCILGRRTIRKYMGAVVVQVNTSSITYSEINKLLLHPP